MDDIKRWIFIGYLSLCRPANSNGSSYCVIIKYEDSKGLYG